jgi:aspartokinase/homoserine dehydrogenase 1
MTDLLVNVVDAALVDLDEATANLNMAVESAIGLLKELASPEITGPIEARFRTDAKDILSVVQSLRMINTVPPVTMEVVTGFGEIWSAQTLHAYLQTQDVPCDWIDARDVLIVKSDGGNTGLGEKGAASTGGVTPLWAETASRMATWWNTNGLEQGFLDLDYTKQSPIVVVTGFVATTADGVPTTLKRSGSDYSATVFAKLTGASRVTMWKNTDGVYTADPRRVPEAFPIASLKYDEAMELAYFGAQVLHPSAMVPCIDDNIPVYVRNIFNPSFEGTVIQGRCQSLKDVAETGKVKNWRSKSGEVPIKGITSVDKTALVTLEGAIGGANVAERFMGAMADSGINVLIITQASSESSITIAVPENEGETAVQALEDAFELEMSRSKIGSISLLTGMSIVAIVGEGMAMNSGVSATFMSSLSRANVNIRVIAQGSSERQVAVVVDAKDASRALRAAHMAFTLSETVVSVAVLGCTGYIGSALVEQLSAQKEFLAKKLGIECYISAASNSKKIAFGKDSTGLDIGKLPELIASDDAADFDLDLITECMGADVNVNPHRVIIDCTDSETVSKYYDRWLSAGINIVGPNRNVGAGSLDYYKSVIEAQKENSVKWGYESSVGSALPILNTIRDLLETGDNVNAIKGAVSGTMAYVLSHVSDDVSFSDAVRRAVVKDYTETDFREDLSGRDMARKVVILARQLDLDVNLEDVEVESLIPDDIMAKTYEGGKEGLKEGLLADIKVVNDVILEKVKAAEAKDCALRYKFSIDAKTGKCGVALEAVPRTDPLFRLKANENLVAFETDRYKISPLIVKGAAAGPDLAASGIFADLLRMTRTFTALQI